MSGDRPDVLIVGGGIIGCALAAELAARGRAVTVIERREPGAEASGAAAGMLAPQHDASHRDAFFDLALESRNLYPAWARVLGEETGIDVGYRQTGLLRCGYGADACRGSPRPATGSARRACRSSTVRRTELAAEVGGRLSPEVARRRLLPRRGPGGPAAADPGRLAPRATPGSARADGAAPPPPSASRTEPVVASTPRRDRSSPTPSWMRRAPGPPSIRGCPCRFPCEPVRGQIVELWLEAPLETIVAADDVYLVPRPDGGVLLGSTVEFVGFRKEVTAQAVDRLIAAAVRLVPALASARFVTAWAGLRPGTPDGLPVLGRCPIRGCFFAAGHFRNGILLAPVTARILADCLTGAAPRDLSAFSVERFAGALQPT